MPLKDKDGDIVNFCPCGIKRISTPLERIELKVVWSLFENVSEWRLKYQKEM